MMISSMTYTRALLLVFCVCCDVSSLSIHVNSRNRGRNQESVRQMSHSFSTSSALGKHVVENNDEGATLKIRKVTNTNRPERYRRLTPSQTMVETLNDGTKVPQTLPAYAKQSLISNSNWTEPMHQSQPQSQLEHAVKEQLPGEKAKQPYTSGGQTIKSQNTEDPLRELTNVELYSGDKFHCSPCVCVRTAQGEITANCTTMKLNGVPQDLPVNISSLDMSRNKLKLFSTKSVQLYSSTLLRLYVSNNERLDKIANDPVANYTMQIIYLDISRNGIRYIDDQSFAVMDKLAHLDLSHNKIEVVTSLMFSGLGHLSSLSLSGNSIMHIENNAFDPLLNLKQLDLSQNSHLGYDQLSPRLFKPLKWLQLLDIHGSSKYALNYPNKALQQLHNLRSLDTDGLKHNTFRHEMKSLKKFIRLNIRPCQLKEIGPNFFTNVPYLRVLQINGCRLKRFDPQAYTSLKNIESLSLSFMYYYDIHDALRDLKYLTNSSLTSLALVHMYHSAKPCVWLNRTDGLYLSQTKLEVLDLSNNRLALLEDVFIQQLPKSLKRLILRKNKFTFLGLLVTRMVFLHELIELDLRDQNNDVTGTSQSFQNSFNSQTSSTSKENCAAGQYELGPTYDLTTLPGGFEMTAEPDTDRESSVGCGNKQGAGDVLEFLRPTKDDVRLENKNINLNLTQPVRNGLKMPPKLKLIHAEGYFGYGLFFLQKFVENNSLTTLYFSNSYLTTWGNKYMPRGIQLADLSHNYCNHIHYHFFRYNNSLRYLNLSNNFLGPDFAEDNNGLIFTRLDKIRYLDISMNSIYKLPQQFFRGLSGVQKLKLSNNKLQKLNSSFSQTKSLSFLDASKNSITWITKEVRTDLDNIAHLHSLVVDLTNNPLPCTCSGLEILTWMATTRVRFLSADFLQCVLDNDQIVYIGNLHNRVLSLQRECTSKRFIVVISGASMTLFIFILGFAMMYRYRWKLRYMKYVAMAKLFGFKPKVNEDGNYKFDAYLLYPDTAIESGFIGKCIKELEEERGHKLCIADRDFLPGSLISLNIISAIQNSTKTIPLAAPDFYDGVLSEYSVKMAFMEEHYQRRSVLHLCLYQPMPEEELSLDFLMLMKRDDYTQFSPEDEVSEDVRKHSWDQMSRAIGHMARQN